MITFFRKTNMDFVSLKNRYTAFIISITLILIGIVSFIIKGPRYGIDFAGGVAIRLKFISSYSVEEIRKILKEINLENSIIQKFGKANDEVLIRIKIKETKKPGETISKVQNILNKKLNANEINKIDINFVDDPKKIEEKLKTFLSLNKYLKEVSIQIIEYKNTHGGIIKSFDELTFIPVEILNIIKENFFLGKFIIRESKEIGPAAGKTLQWQAILAVFMAMIGILIYVGVRFEFKFALAADLALLHDALISLGFLSLTNREININIIAALLIIIGYSINDTIVIFDRIREGLKIYKNEPFEKIMNKSINETLNRTMNTSLTTLLVVISLFFFGGEILHDFAFILIVGIIVGTYSSIFIASNLIIEWNYRKMKADASSIKVKNIKK